MGRKMGGGRERECRQESRGRVDFFNALPATPTPPYDPEKGPAAAAYSPTIGSVIHRFHR
jgi:hypothetical protein